LKFLVESYLSVISKKNVLNQAAIMTGARILGLALGAVGMVWAARCLGPKNLGLSGMVQNVVVQASLLIGIISPTVLVREYKNAKSEKAKNRLVQATNGFRLLLATVLCAIAGLIMGFGLVPSAYRFAGWFFIPIFLLTSIQPTWIFQATEKQHFQSMIAVIQPALAALLYLVWFKPGMSAGADLLVNSIVAIVMTIILWKAVYKLSILKEAFFKFDQMKEILALIYRSRWLFMSVFAIYIYTILEQPLLGWLYSLEELGKYRTAVNATNAAQAFFTIIPVILYPRFIEWRKRGEDILWRRQLKLAAFFSVGGGLISLLGFVIIPFLYPVVFGLAFAQAAIPCAILFLSKIVVIITGIFYWGLVTDDRHDRYLSLAMLGTAFLSLFLNLILIPKWGMYAASTVNLTSEFIVLIVCIHASIVRTRSRVLKRF